MYKLLFVCHGNICRSPMAQFYLQWLVHQKGVSDMFEIDSAAMTCEELGNPIYPPALRELKRHGIDDSVVKLSDHRARLMKQSDYDYYDLIIAMDSENLRHLRQLLGIKLPNKKIKLLMDYAHCHRDVADPWYTNDFGATWNDIERGCNGILRQLINW
ncbi:MAG: low molecular weight phosphotyrosine protein phosphatase [Bacteroidales bacterium]|nr:low molecular weight phosphotyrosine protein phosphatase [Candidatus Colimorpha onthohippi]